MSGLEPLQRLVLWQLVEHMPNCSPSISRLAQRTGCCERTVKACIAELEQAGWLRVSRRFGARSYYELTGAPRAPVDDSGALVTGAARAPVHPKTGAARPRVSRAPVHHVHPTGALHAPEPGQHMPPKQEQADQEADRIASGAPDAPVHHVPRSLAAAAPPQVWFTLDGWEPSPELIADAAIQGINRESFERRLAKLRTGPIGGRRGVLDRDDYVRAQFPKWRRWDEEERFERHQRRTKEARPPRSPGLTGAGARKVLEEFE
jgi:hypothetical protein